MCLPSNLSTYILSWSSDALSVENVNMLDVGQSEVNGQFEMPMFSWKKVDEARQLLKATHFRSFASLFNLANKNQHNLVFAQFI